MLFKPPPWINDSISLWEIADESDAKAVFEFDDTIGRVTLGSLYE